MLQQTQVERVIEKYRLFVKTFPDFKSLAKAPLREILHVWQGLGYNRRAVALKGIAEKVVADYGGGLPSSEAELRTLPGIGRYSAPAILAFAYDKPTIFVETNIRRVFIHLFFDDRGGIRDSEIFPLIEKTLDRSNPREWYYALMDYGVMLGKARVNPNRRSAHYRKQSPFRDSDRQRRGMILKLLVKRSGASVPEMARELGIESEKIKGLLADLRKEGFVSEEKGKYMIP